MTLYFPDVNVWLALTDVAHRHRREAWDWHGALATDSRMAFSRFTQLGLLRLLTTNAAMGGETLNLGEAWEVYDRWLADPRVEFYPEPRSVDTAFRKATESFAKQAAPKAVGDCWLLAVAKELNATLVSFDRALIDLAKRQGLPAVIPS